ncbi:hypothetical protein QBC34DRAFT_468682 [Podospora aff. communis PSN243]|uniref:Ig-like domain-containing protein n=1 Tax=Podospora aff. communis PSN243 TaxID=3040156 RepID=A0AAV9GGD8_9PEZI|nr:hypothetical protein QBC34DRAFT_468682 [Podospora aff. communis PSN243]
MALALVTLGLVFSFAAAAPNAIVPRQTSPANCTTNSFTIPSWYVQEFKTVASDATFAIQNRATGASTALTCKSGSGEGWSCSSSDTTLQVSLEVKEKTASVDVKQSWSCNDRNPASPIAFAAEGTASIPVVCDGAACKSSNPVDLVRGSLTTPFPVTPEYASGPPGHSQAGCAAVSEKPQWALNTIIFLNETGDGAGAVATQSIQFQVTNLANGYVAGCLNYFDDSASTVLINCGGGLDAARRNRYSITTRTTFDPRSFTFTINETWYCDDLSAAQPASYTATGTTTLPLKCVTELGRTACEADSVPVSGTLLSRTSLTPYSIQDPLPAADGCTISSVVSPAWTITNFEVVTPPSTPAHDHGHGAPAAPAAPGSVGFNIKLNTQTNAFDYPVFATNRAVTLADKETWWPCSFGTGEQPLAPRSCKFRYEAGEEAVVRVDADWVCVDLDAGSPIVFNGIATAKLPKLECETVGVAGGHGGAAGGRPTRCGMEEGTSLVAKVENVTWKVVKSL